jgi:hypothetical protein
MEQSTLVDSLSVAVLDGLPTELIEYWANPPGRLRTDERRNRADWIKGLSASDREFLNEFAAEAAHTALFGVLAVLDGSRAIENPPTRGHLELRYVSASGAASLMASSASDMPVLPLHELL